MREGYSSGNLCNVQPVHPTPRLYLTLVDTIIELTKKLAEAPCNARQGEAGERWGGRIRNPNLHPFFAFGDTTSGGRSVSETRKSHGILSLRCTPFSVAS